MCGIGMKWYERHMAYFRVVSLREPFMDVINLLNEQPYTIHVGEIGDTFRVDDVVFGGLVPWEGVWYWSGVQQRYEHVTDEAIQQIKRDFPLQASQVVYRYCPQLAEKARDIVRKHYQQFLDYYGTELVIYPNGKAMVEDVHKFHQYQFDTAPNTTTNLHSSCRCRAIRRLRWETSAAWLRWCQEVTRARAAWASKARVGRTARKRPCPCGTVHPGAFFFT